MKNVWLITGCSTGFGRALAQELLENGYRVAVTARNIDQIKDLADAYPETAIALTVDVTIPTQIKEAVDATITRFGQIDVLVNNAGIGYFAAIEESEDEEIRKIHCITDGNLNMIEFARAILRKAHKE